jgi:hypothetical protein
MALFRVLSLISFKLFQQLYFIVWMVRTTMTLAPDLRAPVSFRGANGGAREVLKGAARNFRGAQLGEEL